MSLLLETLEALLDRPGAYSASPNPKRTRERPGASILSVELIRMDSGLRLARIKSQVCHLPLRPFTSLCLFPLLRIKIIPPS